jgi:glycosyltransferase involved in cell wall biosynthesis
MPQVSIGLPVYNGGRFLRPCLDSLLHQTFTDFELIICDNASTDDTEQVCREYLSRDSRIAYYRNAENVGAARNYNLTFDLASGRYFKWSSHDDLCGAQFLERCVEALERNPEIVLAYPKMVDIDVEGRTIGVRNISHIPRSERGAAARTHQRFRRLIRTDYTVEEIFGVIRADVLRKTSLIKSYTDSDRTLLAEIGLYGRFVEVPEVLFFHRMHEEMSTRAFPDWQERAAWFDPSKRGRPGYPMFKQFSEYLRIIWVSPVGRVSKAWCYLWMLNWIRNEWRGLAGDLRYACTARGRGDRAAPRVAHGGG